jgi:hypothetical protein
MQQGRSVTDTIFSALPLVSAVWGWLSGEDLLPLAAAAATPTATPSGSGSSGDGAHSKGGVTEATQPPSSSLVLTTLTATEPAVRVRRKRRQPPHRTGPGGMPHGDAQPPPPPPQQQQYATIVVVPEGVCPGQELRVRLVDGSHVSVRVPEGALPGERLRVETPPLAAAGTAHHHQPRGTVAADAARVPTAAEELEEEEEEEEEAEEEEEEEDLCVGLVKDPKEGASLEALRAALRQGDGSSPGFGTSTTSVAVDAEAWRAMRRAFGGETRCLLRYLRLHKQQPAAAAEAVRATLAFRAQHGVDDILERWGTAVGPADSVSGRCPAAASQVAVPAGSVLARVLPHWPCAYSPCVAATDGSPILLWKIGHLHAAGACSAAAPQPQPQPQPQPPAVTHAMGAQEHAVARVKGTLTSVAIALPGRACHGLCWLVAHVNHVWRGGGGVALFDAVSEEEFTQFFCYWMELGLARQRASLQAGLQPAGVTEIFDFEGMGFGALTDTGLRCFGRVLGLGQQHYPENLARGVLINAPWFFSRGFAMVKPLLNQSTVDQLQIMSSDWAETVAELMPAEELNALFVAPPVLHARAGVTDPTELLCCAVSTRNDDSV